MAELAAERRREGAAAMSDVAVVGLGYVGLPLAQAAVSQA